MGPTTTYLGADSAVHLSEELKDASHVLPRAMFSAAIINYVLGFVTTISFMFSLGNIDDDLASRTGQPWVAVIQRITGSKAATIVLIVVMIIMVSSSTSLPWQLSVIYSDLEKYFFCAVNQVCALGLAGLNTSGPDSPAAGHD